MPRNIPDRTIIVVDTDDGPIEVARFNGVSANLGFFKDFRGGSENFIFAPSATDNGADDGTDDDGSDDNTSDGSNGGGGNDGGPTPPNGSSPGVRVVSPNGAQGGDVIRGTAGDDVVRGGAGNDYLLGLDGADQLDGGEGFDVAAYSESRTGVTIDLTDPSQSTGEARGDTFQSIEAFRLTDFADTFIGGARVENDANNDVETVYGFGGDDVMDGGTVASPQGGSYRFFGGEGNDVLRTGTGADELYGGTGDDMLTVTDQSGGSRLYGGEGADRFVFEAGADADIFDYEKGVDVLDLSDIGVAFESLSIFELGGTTRIDFEGDGVSEIRLVGLTGIDLSEDDFIL